MVQLYLLDGQLSSGRYDHNGSGKVRVERIPDLILNLGRDLPLGIWIKWGMLHLSDKSGQNQCGLRFWLYIYVYIYIDSLTSRTTCITMFENVLQIFYIFEDLFAHSCRSIRGEKLVWKLFNRANFRWDELMVLFLMIKDIRSRSMGWVAQ